MHSHTFHALLAQFSPCYFCGAMTATQKMRQSRWHLVWKQSRNGLKDQNPLWARFPHFCPVFEGIEMFGVCLKTGCEGFPAARQEINPMAKINSAHHLARIAALVTGFPCF